MEEKNLKKINIEKILNSIDLDLEDFNKLRNERIENIDGRVWQNQDEIKQHVDKFDDKIYGKIKWKDFKTYANLSEEQKQIVYSSSFPFDRMGNQDKDFAMIIPSKNLEKIFSIFLENNLNIKFNKSLVEEGWKLKNGICLNEKISKVFISPAKLVFEKGYEEYDEYHSCYLKKEFFLPFDKKLFTLPIYYQTYSNQFDGNDDPSLVYRESWSKSVTETERYIFSLEKFNLCEECLKDKEKILSDYLKLGKNEKILRINEPILIYDPEKFSIQNQEKYLKEKYALTQQKLDSLLENINGRKDDKRS